MSIPSDFAPNPTDQITVSLPFWYLYKAVFLDSANGGHFESLLEDFKQQNPSFTDSYSELQWQGEFEDFVKSKNTSSLPGVLDLDAQNTSIFTFLRTSYVQAANRAFIAQVDSLKNSLETNDGIISILNKVIELYNKQKAVDEGGIIIDQAGGENQSYLYWTESSLGDIDPETGKSYREILGASYVELARLQQVLLKDVKGGDTEDAFFTQLSLVLEDVIIFGGGITEVATVSAPGEVRDYQKYFEDNIDSINWEEWQTQKSFLSTPNPSDGNVEALIIAERKRSLGREHKASIESNLRSSLAASQSVSSVDQALMKRAMFTFEEFYQSASTMARKYLTIVRSIAKKF